MSIQTDRSKIEEQLNIYRERLDVYTDADYLATPAENVWCYAEVYSHILQATYQSLLAAEQCANGQGKFLSQKSGFIVRLILLAGMLPPGKYKAPSKLAALTTKMSKEDARNLIIRTRKKLDSLTPLISKANPNMRVKHPRLGMLNAEEWLRFTYIHLKHHVRQLNRIGKMLHKK